MATGSSPPWAPPLVGGGGAPRRGGGGARPAGAVAESVLRRAPFGRRARRVAGSRPRGEEAAAEASRLRPPAPSPAAPAEPAAREPPPPPLRPPRAAATRPIPRRASWLNPPSRSGWRTSSLPLP